MAVPSDKQKAFAREYLIDLNATQAAIRAGYSKKTAKSIGQENLTKPYIQDLIEEGRKEAQKRNEVTLDDILAEYKRIAFGGMSKFVRINADNEPEIDLSQCSPEDIDLLSETQIEAFTENKGSRQVRRVKIKTMDRLKALETLGKHLGLGEKTRDDAINNLADAFRAAGVTPQSMPIATRDEDDEDEK